MPTYSLIDRERGITRDRARPNAPGHFITIFRYNKGYYLVYPRSDRAYIKWWPYVHPYPHPIGYVFAPPPWPPLRRLQDVSPSEYAYTLGTVPPGFEALIPIPEMLPPPSLPSPPALPGITSPFTPPETMLPRTPEKTEPPTVIVKLPEGVQQVYHIRAKDFVGMELELTSDATYLALTRTPIMSIAIIANPDNTDAVMVMSSASGRAGPLYPGMAIVLEIDDLSKVALYARSGVQKVGIFYEVAPETLKQA